MKKILGFLILIFCIHAASGQLFYVEAGKVLSSFDYKTSQGNSIGDLTGSNQNNMGVGFRLSLFRTSWHFTCGAQYNKYGAKGSDAALGNYYEWDISYLGTNIGIDYEFLKPPVTQNEQHGFSYYIRSSTSVDFLIRGSQQLNNQIFDLRGKEEFDKPIYFLKGVAGTNYYINKAFILFAQYSYGRSILLGNYTNQEQLRITSHNFSVGLQVNLAYRK